jgi:hypothetical protein
MAPRTVKRRVEDDSGASDLQSAAKGRTLDWPGIISNGVLGPEGLRRLLVGWSESTAKDGQVTWQVQYMDSQILDGELAD